MVRLSMSATAVWTRPRAIFVLCHRDPGMPKVVGADPRGQALVVDEGCYRFAEAMRRRARHAEITADLDPPRPEVVGVAIGGCRGWEDHRLLPEIRQIAPGRQNDGSEAW